MKMILNEYRLLPFQKEAQVLIAKTDGRVPVRRRGQRAARVCAGEESLK